MMHTCKINHTHTSIHESTGMGIGWGPGCALCGWGGDRSQMYGDAVGIVVKYMGMGWKWKIHGDGVGMGLIFTTVSLFTSYDNTRHHNAATVTPLLGHASRTAYTPIPTRPDRQTAEV